MFYPTGQKKEYQKSVITYKNRGMSLENLINSANEYYLDNDLAAIYKKPTPIGLVSVDYKKNEIKKAYFKDKSTLDYNGLYKGKYLDFDAKESHSHTSFSLSNIHEHQIKHISRVLRLGGIAFLIVYINYKYYILRGEDLIDFIDNNDRKSIPISFFKEKCYEIEERLRPTLDYLKIVDKIYFKGDNENGAKKR